MRVVRGRARSPDADRNRSRSLLERAGEQREAAVRVWRPHRQVAFGRRDVRSQGYDAARAAAAEYGFPAVERDVGGRAVAYTGRTLAFARYEPLDDPREGLEARYDRVESRVQAALSAVGVEAVPGEPPSSFCPGTHSFQAEGKLVGIAQRVTAGAAVVAGILIVEDHEGVATVLEPVYTALGVPFDPDTVGSVARSGGRVDGLRDELETQLVEGHRVEIETIRGE